MKKAIAAIFFTVLFFSTGTMSVHARKRVSEKEDREKRHAGLLEKLDRDANAARLYEWERKWEPLTPTDGILRAFHSWS